MFRVKSLAVDPADGWWFVLAMIAGSTFLIGLALLGVSRIAGHFYIASLAAGAPVLLRLCNDRLAIPGAVPLYLLALAAFTITCLLHLLHGHTTMSIFDYVSRLWIGVINGFFFLAIFRFDRRMLFSFVGLVAASHATVSISVAFYQGIDFSDLWLTGVRAGGMTNPIPYSNMLFTSVGLAALFVAGRLRTNSLIGEMVLVCAVVSVGLVAVVLTGTRGTLLSFPLLIALLIWSYRDRFSRRAIVAATVAFALVGAFSVAALAALWPAEMMNAIERGGSDDLRLRLLLLSWPIILDAPLLGHGLDSVPEIFAELNLVISEKSRLFSFNHMHNQYLDMLVKTGLVGTVLFFGPVLVAVGAAARHISQPEERSFSLAIFWVAGAYGIFGLTNAYFAHANTILQFGVYFGMLIWLLPPDRIWSLSSGQSIGEAQT